MLRQFLYVSTAQGLAPEIVEQIVESSAVANARNAITGFLLYNGRNFLQLVEGEEENLFSLMRKISADPRHAGLSCLDNSPIDARACPDWGMKRISLLVDVDARKAALEETVPAAMPGVTRSIVMNFALLN